MKVEVQPTEAAKLLGISVEDLSVLETQGLIHSTNGAHGRPSYSANEISQIKKRRGLTVSEEAAQIAIQMQRDLASSVTFTRKVLRFTGTTIVGYVFLVVMSAVSFVVNPVGTGQWFGIVPSIPKTVSLSQKDNDSQVLAAETSATPENNFAPLSILKPIGRVSLSLVKTISPNSYSQVSKVAILDTNDVLGLDTNGAITLDRPINLGESSLLQVGTNDLVANLNSQYLQGLQPGTNVGDLAIVADVIPTPTPVSTLTSPPISGLTNANLSGKAGIVNTNLANSSVTIDTSGPLSGGGPISLGGTLTISCPTCLITGESIFTADSADLVTNKTIEASSNTITGLAASNLVAGDYSSKITSGTYSIDVTGSVSSATNFTGLLAGDVTGNQSSTTVGKINGNVLGLTTPTSGNLLVGNGTSWVTRSLSSDATIDSTGALTLKSVGTPNTYGSTTMIPVLTTDAQGRVFAVTNTAIAGLTNTNLSGAAGISNANLANSSVTINTSGPLSGGGSVSLGGLLTLTCPTCLTSAGSVPFSDILSGTNTTATMIIGNGATLSYSGTGGINANQLLGSTWAIPGAIGATTANTGAFTTLIGTTLNGLTITNNGSNTLSIASGKALTASNSLTFTGTDATSFVFPTISNDIVGRTVTQTLTNKTIAAGLNTISGITSTNLTAGDFSSVISSGLYSINISGSAASATTATTATSATNFSGSLSGDVIGTQGSTTVGKINGNVLGLTTPTSGNFLIGNGTSWITRSIGSDATIDSTGALTLKNTGTAGTFGSALNIPMFVTDAQGRVTSVTNTAISGLTNTNLSGSAGITNANLANASLTLAGNSGSGSVSLGSTLTLSGAGISSITASGSTLTLTSTEADTLASVTGRGASTSTSISTTGGATVTSNGTLTASNGLTLTTGALNLIGTSGALTLSGLSASSISSGANNLILTAGNFNTTATGINSTVVGQTTAAAGKFTTLTTTGVTDLANAGASNITLATTGTGNVTVGNSTGTFALTSNGGLNVTTGGALTGIASLDTISTSGTALTFAGAGTISSTSTNGLTLDSGTTGNVNLGTGANAKTVAIGNTTGGTTLNLNSGTGNINFTVNGTGSSGKVQIGNSGTATPDLLVLDNGTADPTGVNGGMYYNSSTGKFRCFENSAWANCITPPGTDIQHAASYDTDEALTNVAASQVTLGTVSVTPTAATGDIYVTGFAEVRSSNGTDQAFNLVIETTNNCTGSTVGNASNTYTISSAGSTTIHFGNIRVSGIAVDAGASAHPYSLCASTATGDTDVLNWAIEATVIDTGADLAELYTTNDMSLEAGDVVSLDSSLRTGVQKSQSAYDLHLLGVIATNPGLVIGGVTSEGVGALPVALSGRVPVKVSTENGDISSGDYLTSSSIPGIAMKATQTGSNIGMALSNYNNDGVGTVLVFVKNGASAIASDISHDQASILSLVTEAIAKVFTNIVEFFGNVIFHADVTFLGHATFNKDTAGHAFIKAGETESHIVFEKEYDKNPVVTANVNIVGAINPSEVPTLLVYDVTTKGFTIKLAKSVAFDLSFSWTAFAVIGENQSIETPLAIPSAVPTITPTPSLTLEIQIPSPSDSPTPPASPLLSPRPIDATTTIVPLASPSVQVLP